MQKLSMCRICLVDNVRMYVVANKNLQEIYEKLTDTPLATEDRRPILACYFCYAKLKQSYRLQRKCLEAEKWFTQILSEDYEFSGYVISPTESVSIYDESQTRNDAIKEELPDVGRGQDFENRTGSVHEFQDIENVNIKSYHSESEDIPAQYSESDSEDRPPFLEFKTEIKEELEDISTYYSESIDIPPIKTELDTEDYVPLMNFKTEVIEEQEVYTKKLQIETTARPGAELQKQNEERAKSEVTITIQQKKIEQPNTKIIRNTHDHTSEPSSELKEHFTASNSSTLNYSKKPIRINNGEKQYECKICLRSFRDSNDLTKHAGIHAGVKPYKCKLCQKHFTAKGALTKHIRIHNGENPYKRKVKHFNITPKHLVEKTYQCDICQRIFKEKRGLRRHILLHSGEKPYKCHVCQRSFALSSNLKRHIERHTGKNKDLHKCEICQRSYSEKSSLKRHSIIHTGEKPYKCETCQRSFSEMNVLTKHIRRHTGEKPFKCDVCQRNFSDASNLKRHIRIHMSAQVSLS